MTHEQSIQRWKWIAEIFMALAFAIFPSHFAFADLKTVPSVDLNRYLGTWYQISHKPLIFEGGPCSCARQTLSPKTPGVVNVYNSCNRVNAHGPITDIRGTATPDDATYAKLTVDFNLPFKGSYWIIGLDPDYRFAVVSDKNQDALYILSRTPTLAPDLYNQALTIASAQLSLTGLEMTDQTGCNYPVP